jgi:hypothetical protein
MADRVVQISEFRTSSFKPSGIQQRDPLRPDVGEGSGLDPIVIVVPPVAIDGADQLFIHTDPQRDDAGFVVVIGQGGQTDRMPTRHEDGDPREYRHGLFPPARPLPCLAPGSVYLSTMCNRFRSIHAAEADAVRTRRCQQAGNRGEGETLAALIETRQVRAERSPADTPQKPPGCVQDGHWLSAG